MITFEFEGNTFECDETVAGDYMVIKMMSRSRENPAALFDAFERLFNGKDEEYARLVGGKFGKMMDLFAAAVDAVGAKNS